MSKLSILKIALFSWVLFQPALADNPLSNYHYLADPTVLVIDDVFWIIADVDDESVTGYDIKAYYAFSSKDMKNWTDHGEVFRVPRDVSWANNAWAPAAAWRNGKMYIYFPNGGSGVGVVRGNSPAGPFTDPLGGPIINPSKGECDGISWCFDPGVFVDDDGQGYLIWGGGTNTNRPYGNNFSLVKLNEDMISWNGPILKMSGMDKSFEAPYITKRNGTYYLSYNAQGQTIDYATSNSPTGPWNYKGTVMANPNINGQNINAYNNNHHGFAEFKGKWYAAYHDRRMAIAKNDPTPEWHRSISIDELQYNADGSFKPLVFTNSGPQQVGTFNPYDSIPATTSSLQKNIGSKTYLVNNAPPISLLTPKPAQNGGSYIKLSGVDFAQGALTFKVSAASLNGNNKIEIRSGSPTGNLAGTCDLANTGSWTNFTESECDISGLSGTVNELYLKFLGQDSTAGIKWWKFSSSPPIPQGPFDPENIIAIPGVLQAENYDVGGEGKAYHDADAGNNGDKYRTDNVDIDGDEIEGYVVGWTESGEWLEYTVNVITEGDYQFEARVASGADGSAFSLYIDSVKVTEDIAVPNTGSWTDYVTVVDTISNMTTGAHTLRIFMEGSYQNIDWIDFKLKDDIVNSNRQFELTQNQNEYHVFSLTGQLIGKFNVKNSSDKVSQIKGMIKDPGVYLIKEIKSNFVSKIFIQKD